MRNGKQIFGEFVNIANECGPGIRLFSGKGCILRQTTTTTWAFWRSATAATMKALPHFTFTIASPLGRWTCIASTPSDPIPSFPAITTPQFAMAPASHAQKPWKSERKKHTEEPPPAAASSSPFFGGHSDSLGPKQVHNSGVQGQAETRAQCCRKVNEPAMMTMLFGHVSGATCKHDPKLIFKRVAEWELALLLLLLLFFISSSQRVEYKVKVQLEFNLPPLGFPWLHKPPLPLTFLVRETLSSDRSIDRSSDGSIQMIIFQGTWLLPRQRNRLTSATLFNQPQNNFHGALIIIVKGGGFNNFRWW